jgi:hypothetical protein
MTKEACHGCGKHDIGPLVSYQPDGQKGPRPFRGTNEVCTACKQLMKDGERWRQHVSRSARSAEGITVISTSVDYGYRGYYEGESNVPPGYSHFDDAYRAKLSNPRYHAGGLRAELQHVMWMLASAVSEETQAEFWGSAKDEPPRMFMVNGDYSFRTLSLIHPLLHRLINDLDVLIRLVLHWSYWNGVRHGRNLIRQLNAGEVTVSALDEEGKKEARELQTLHDRIGVVMATPKQRKARA